MRKIAFEVVVDVYNSDETTEQIQKSLKTTLKDYGWDVVSVATKSYETPPTLEVGVDTRTWKERVADLATLVEKMPMEKDNRFIKELNEFCDAVVNEYKIHLGKTVDGKLERGNIVWKVALPALDVDIHVFHNTDYAIYSGRVYRDPSELISAIIEDRGDKLAWLYHRSRTIKWSPML